jgi:hypothetical protein
MISKLDRAPYNIIFIIYSWPDFHPKHVRVYTPLNTVIHVGFQSDTDKARRFDHVFQTSEKSIPRSLTAVEFHCLSTVAALYFTTMFTTNQLSKSQHYVFEAWSQHVWNSSSANVPIVACRRLRVTLY